MRDNVNMNILFVPNKDPRLTNGGSEQRTNLLWNGLKPMGTVYTFVSDVKLDNELEIIDGPHPIFKYRPIINKRSLWYVLNVIICKYFSFSVWKHKSVKQPNVFRTFKGVKFDFVVSRYIHPLCEHDYWKIAPLLIDIDDHPYQVYQTIYKNHLPIGLKTIGKYITMWQTKYIVRKAIGGWIANEEQLVLCGENYGFLPNIPQMPSNAYKIDYSERKHLFTVGTMGYEPNKEGVTHFLKQIWPSFHQKYPNVQYLIAGKGASEAEANYWNSFEGVKYLGYVEDIEKLYEKSLAAVVPVYSGGGTCIKTLEAMAYSRPCISTSFGARGLPGNVIEQEKGILVFNDAMTFIKAFERVLSPNRRKRIELLGRDVISHQYSADCFNKALERVLLKVRDKIDSNL